VLGRGLKFKPESCGGDSRESEEVSGGFFIAGRDPSKVLQLVKEALDEIALPIEFGAEGAPRLAIGVKWDICAATLLFDQLDDPIGIVRLVTHHDVSLH